MKRKVVILLSAFVLLLAVHPALAFHFCGGDLSSVEVPYWHDAGLSCCCGGAAGTGKASVVAEAGCCHMRMVYLSTDNYLQQDTLQVPPCTATAFFEFRVPSCLLFSPFQRIVKADIPPLLCHERGRERLSRFCVYLI
ncbi:MAG: hypothetical protein LUC45_10080 [Paraprevotella sp.]|nr:hypothetical protein [Paraprevotella sp.]